MNMRLSYRISKESGWAEDENGNATETYNQVKLECNSYTMPKEEYEKFIEIGINMTAALFGIDEKYIEPITLNEYLDMTEEED